jgi:ABC-type transport system involved in multi-copper enzyme maturation permease subunit
MTMKYFAIFKDSLRESLDSKVLYVMIGLSCLVIVLVAGTGFTPESPEPALKAIVSRFPGSLTFGGQTPPLRYTVEDFHQDNDARHPWEAEYEFAIRVVEQSPSTFRRLVWLLRLPLDYDEPGLTDEQRKAMRELARIRDRAPILLLTQADSLPLTPQMKEAMAHVSPADMAAFVRDELSVVGELQTTQVDVKTPSPREVVFQVRAHGKPQTARTWPHTVSLLYGAATIPVTLPVGEIVYFIEDTLVGAIGAGIIMLIATVITAFFIPTMLRKGSIELLLSKPIRRSALLVYKYLGGLLFMFLNTVVIVLGIYLVVGLRSGLWPVGFVLTIFVLTFQFAIFYAVSTLFAVLTRSPIVAILVACFAWVVLFSVGVGYRWIEANRKYYEFPGWLTTTADAVHFVLPRYKDLDTLSGNLVARDLLGPESEGFHERKDQVASINWAQSLGFSTGFIALMLGLACWRFATRDY